MSEEKQKEQRLRRAAARQGLRLEKTKRRDPRALDWGTYHLVDIETNSLAVYGLSSGYGLTLDEVEEALSN